MLPLTLGHIYTGTASDVITETHIVSASQKNYYNSYFWYLKLLFVLTNVKQFDCIKHFYGNHNIWYFLSREHNQIYLILTQPIVNIL